MRKTKKARTSKYNALRAELYINGTEVSQIKPTDLTLQEKVKKLFQLSENTAATPEEQKLRKEIIEEIGYCERYEL